MIKREMGGRAAGSEDRRRTELKTEKAEPSAVARKFNLAGSEFGGRRCWRVGGRKWFR